MKHCNDCGLNKHLREFSKNARKPDGLDIYCKSCTGLRSRGHYQRNKKKRREQNVAWLAANPGAAAAYCQKWRDKNPGAQGRADANWYANNRVAKLSADKFRRDNNLEKFLERERKSYERNRESARKKNERWRKKNPAKINMYAAERRKSVAERTPPWLTPEHLDEIYSFYVEAARLQFETGIVHHVDHIVPLRGRIVCGLHVPWNLQVLTRIDNLKKSNQHAA